MKRTFLALLLSGATSLSFCAEPSAFGAGDLTSDNPYGLTPDEKVLLETKKKLRNVDISTKTHASQLDSLRERIDGLQDIIEALSRKSHNNKIALKTLEDKETIANQSNDEYQKRLSETITQDSQNIKVIQEQIQEISKLVDQINSTYVSKAEFNTFVADINEFKALVANELKKGTAVSTSSGKVTSADLYNSAKKNFDSRNYTKAIEEYTELINRKYKPAYSHYMIGEIYYKRKDYGQAISYFKKSSELYSKASYMPELMLHTAVSMENTGDKSHAQAFYQAIIQKYPNSSEAAEAKKHLN